VDVGTGDGAFVCSAARRNPDTLVIGVDANADNLRDNARKVARKARRGGLPNVVFGRTSLDDAPGELHGIADSLTVLFPWGSLLRAVAMPDHAQLERLRGLARPNATVRIVFGYDPTVDAAAVGPLGPIALLDEARLDTLRARYREVGIIVCASRLSAGQVRELPTTWAKRLAFSPKQREFVELRGTVQG